MSKFVANPVEVEAFQIRHVGPDDARGDVPLILEDGKEVVATREMCSRYMPKTGDYWVIQSDGYIYLNPQHVFLRKYTEAL